MSSRLANLSRLFPTLPWLVKPRALFGPLRVTPIQRRALLRLIAVATEERLELPLLLEAWSREEWGWQGRRLELLAEALRGGLSIGDAVERVPGVLGDADTLLVRFAEQSGTLSPMLRERLKQPLDPSATGSSPLRTAANYALTFLIAFFPVVMFTQLEVQPEFQKICNEFTLDPGITPEVNALLTTAITCVAAVLLLVLFFAAVSRISDRPGQFFRRRLAPWALRVVRERRVGAVLARLGSAASLGRPVPGAIATLARYHYDVSLRRRLLVVGNEIALGESPWAALRSAGLINKDEATALSDADDLGLRGWTLYTLGVTKEAHADRVERRWAAAVAPMLIVLFAGFVLLHAQSVFIPLIRLIEGLL